MKKYQLCLSDEMYEAMVSRSLSTGVPMSVMFRWAMKAWLGSSMGGVPKTAMDEGDVVVGSLCQRCRRAKRVGQSLPERCAECGRG